MGHIQKSYFRVEIYPESAFCGQQSRGHSVLPTLLSQGHHRASSHFMPALSMILSGVCGLAQC